jgi:hypothetical protein
MAISIIYINLNQKQINMKNYESIAAALSDLKERGYNADFTAETETVCLYCGELDMRLDFQEYRIDEVHRFDCNSVHNENTVLYAISDPASGAKGVLIDSSGADSCSLNNNYLKKLLFI